MPVVLVLRGSWFGQVHQMLHDHILVVHTLAGNLHDKKEKLKEKKM